MIAIDRDISLGVWLASLGAASFVPHGHWLVLATTINLLHSRFVDWWCGRSFRTRVMTILADELDEHRNRLRQMEQVVADIKESQLKIATSFRGRTLP